VSPLAVKLAAMASTEKPVSMMFLRTLDANETRPSRLPSATGTAGPPVWFWNKNPYASSISVGGLFKLVLGLLVDMDWGVFVQNIRWQTRD
jgi:hypothetical protein